VHEHGLMKDLMRRILSTAATENARRVTGVSVRLGALSHMTPGHFGEHYEQAAAGTIAEGAALDIATSDDITDPNATDVVLTAVEVET
jgi:hydrogenase nickel incorporation protein HypA/HybF